MKKVKNAPSTQRFTEIKDIDEHAVLLANGDACSIIEVQATNFDLLEEDEKRSKIASYASFLNSLAFPIQILIRNKREDVSAYLALLDEQTITVEEPHLSTYLSTYKEFVQNLVKENGVLDKKCFIVVSYSSLEEGASGAFKKEDFNNRAKDALTTKTTSLLTQLARLALYARLLKKDELVSVYYEIYNAQQDEGSLRKMDNSASLTDLIAPSSVEVDFKHIRVGDVFYRTFFMVGYPRFVSMNWLNPLINFDHSLDISLFAYPVESSDVMGNLKRKIAEMEATLSSQTEHGHVVDPKVTAALEDAYSLQEELAKGMERFFQFSFYVQLSSVSLSDLDEATKRLRSTLSSLLLVEKTATLQMEEGFKSALPMGQNKLFITRNMDTTSLASTFPFTSATLTQNKGVLYGVNQENGSLVIFDRFSLENANEVVLGKSGSGKSYLIKLEIMRQFLFGTEVIVVDPEGEYGELAKALNGDVISFTPSSPININPFDLSGLYEEGENELGLKILSLHGLLKIVAGNLDAGSEAVLDRAFMETYRQKGVTSDPATQKNAPPLMEDLYKTLLGIEDPRAQELALVLERFIKGSLSGIFNQPSNVAISNPLTIFSIRDLEEQLRPIAMHLILDFVWTRIRKSLKKRVLVLDEAWYLMKHEDSASFVHSIAKRARKYYLGLTTATQDVEDFLSTDYGKAVLSNSSIQVLLKVGAAEADTVARIFHLTQGEKQRVLQSEIGHGLFFAGQNHVSLKVLAAPFEHSFITSKPQDILEAQKTP